MTDRPVAMMIHGGAGPLRGGDYSREVAHMRGLVEAGRDRLTAGAAALEVVQATIVALEASGLYVAGRGASPNTDGAYELDASLMHGPSRRLGAVAAQIAHRVRFAAEPLGLAAEAALADVAALGGEGGLIALSATGEVVMPYNSAGMKRAALYPDGRIVSDVFQAAP